MRVITTFLFAALLLIADTAHARLQGGAEQNTTTTEPPPSNSDGIPLAKVPTGVHRQAAQLLEDVRYTDNAPGWDDHAFIAKQVQPLLRPDIDGIAYYEFKVNVDSNERAGYIIASTGPFDFPIAHWNFEGLSPTEELDKVAADKDKTISRYYKIDSLSYTGEDINGNLVAQIGELPPEIEGLTLGRAKSILAHPEDGVESFERAPGKRNDDELGQDDDDDGGHAKYKEEDDENQPWSFSKNNVARSKNAAWRSQKASFRSMYEVPIKSLRNDAAKEWETEANAQEFGEALVVGEPFTVALLFKLESFEVIGEGRDFVEVEEGETTLILEATQAPDEDSLDVEIVLNYANGKTEFKKFAILSEKALAEMEAQDNEDEGGRKLSQETHWVDGVRNLGSWSSWHYFWAGTDADQRHYSQIPKKTTPNTSSCSSGCGATAWAMLFGWGDYKASQSGSGWGHRWGLYREDGGYGGNAVAPKRMDRGVRNMTWEIRRYVDTFCWGNSGATYPWKMKRGTKYLKGRAGVGWTIKWNSLGISTDSIRKKARDSIIDRKTPAIIGTGWLKHYPLAYGYAWRKRRVKKCFIVCWYETQYKHSFYVNNGWGGNKNGWVSASTWFAGSILK